MRELVIKNVKTAEYADRDLNRDFDPNGLCKHVFAYGVSYVAAPWMSGGEGKLTVDFYTLPPGKSTFPYHQQTGWEEVFYIISGTATLKTHKGDVIVSEGDVIVAPPNENGAHMLTNNSDEPVVYLKVATVGSPEVVYYPDTGKVRIFTESGQKSFKIDTEVGWLDGE